MSRFLREAAFFFYKPKIMKPLTFFLVSFLLVLSLFSHPDHTDQIPHWQKATGWPDRIITTFSDDPATTISVTWRTDSSVGRTIAEIALATADARFDIQGQVYRAKTEHVDLEHMVTEDGERHSLYNIGIGPVHYHSIVFEDLEPDTLYAFRVQGARGKWSEWFQVQTAAKNGPVQFVYFGDSQNGVRPNWSRVIRMANQKVPTANFFLHAGDLVAKADSDYNWAEWFDAGGFIHVQTPVIPVPGNHENMRVWTDGPDGPTVRSRTTMWEPQFTLPVEEDLPKTLHENAYDIRYNEDLHVFVVDSARFEFEDQAKWLDKGLSETDAKWTVVTMHHPFFTPKAWDTRDIDDVRRKAIAPIVSKHEVDLVLTGHIHTYGRSSAHVDTEQTSRLAEGEAYDVKTVYVISASGAKSTLLSNEEQLAAVAGDRKPDMKEIALERIGLNTPMFQVIKIDGDILKYEARDATGTLYDEFTIVQDETGNKQLTNGAAAFGDTRLFSNTGKYREWWDMR